MEFNADPSGSAVHASPPFSPHRKSLSATHRGRQPHQHSAPPPTLPCIPQHCAPAPPSATSLSQHLVRGLASAGRLQVTTQMKRQGLVQAVWQTWQVPREHKGQGWGAKLGTDPPLFLVLRTMSLLHCGHFLTGSGMAG